MVTIDDHLTMYSHNINLAGRAQALPTQDCQTV
jgi:hypothetical protein